MKLAKSLTSLLSASVLFGSGCKHYEGNGINNGVDSSIRERKTYAVSEKILELNSKYDLKSMDMTFSNDKNTSFFYFDDKTKKKSPLVIVMSMGMTNGLVCNLERTIGAYFADCGMSSVVMRDPQPNSKFTKIEYIDTVIDDSVESARNVIDWAERQEDIDSKKIATVGFSVAGFKGISLLREENRVSAYVLGLIGEDVPYLVCNSKYDKVREAFDQFLERSGINEKEARRKLGELRNDPAKFADKLDSTKVFLILAKNDSVVLYEKELSLAKKMGDPERFVYSTDHFGPYVYLPRTSFEALKFIKRKFEQIDRDKEQYK